MADLKHYKRYGWTCSEDNLKTLPSTAPKEARDLAQWLTLEGRRSTLVELLNCTGDDGRIHGKFWHIGAWTHRMAHTNPNSANIPSAFSKTPTTPVEEIKQRYDHRLRECFTVPEGHTLVGCDAEGIQLRILAHYMESEDYVKAICTGDSKLKTDIHSLNQRALGPICRSRDDAKTFIYAWLLGAGIPKISSILGCSIPDAKKAVNQFLDSLPELKRLKNIKVKADAAKGHFIGLDGRVVPCNSDHLMLAGYLQNGEAVIMKNATLKWRRDLIKAGYDFKLVNFVHDEWQIQVKGGEEEAKEVGKIVADSIEYTGNKLKLFCPLAGSFNVGKTWADTH